MNINDGKYVGQLTAEQVIEQYEYRIGIHDTYAGLVLDDPEQWLSFGSYEFHMWAINGYQWGVTYIEFYLNPDGKDKPKPKKGFLNFILTIIQIIKRMWRK